MENLSLVQVATLHDHHSGFNSFSKIYFLPRIQQPFHGRNPSQMAWISLSTCHPFWTPRRNSAMHQICAMQTTHSFSQLDAFLRFLLSHRISQRSIEPSLTKPSYNFSSFSCVCTCYDEIQRQDEQRVGSPFCAIPGIFFDSWEWTEVLGSCGFFKNEINASGSIFWWIVIADVSWSCWFAFVCFQSLKSVSLGFMKKEQVFILLTITQLKKGASHQRICVIC